MLTAERSLDRVAATSRVAVLGVGNVLRTDEGVGVHVIEALAGRVPENVDLIDGGTLGFSLLESISGCDTLIVVDAAKLDLPPGDIRVFVNEEMDTFVRRPGAVSVHEVSVSDLLDLARLRDELPMRRALIAIQPESLEWGSRPRPSVETAIGIAADRVRELLAEWPP